MNSGIQINIPCYIHPYSPCQRAQLQRVFLKEFHNIQLTKLITGQNQAAKLVVTLRCGKGSWGGNGEYNHGNEVTFLP